MPWHDCRQLMSSALNRDWFNLHDIYLSIQSRLVSVPRQISRTDSTNYGIIISSIDWLGFAACHLLMLAQRRTVIVHTGRPVCHTKAASISPGAWTLRMRPDCAEAGTQCPSCGRLPVACSLRLIDFPLLCHCGGLFKHTLCDVRPQTSRHAQAKAKG